MLTGFSTWPLQVASLIGFVFTVVGTVTLLVVVVRNLLYGGAPVGFPFLASMIAILTSAPRLLIS